MSVKKREKKLEDKVSPNLQESAIQANSLISPDRKSFLYRNVQHTYEKPCVLNQHLITTFQH